MIKSCEEYTKMTDEDKFKSRTILFWDGQGSPRLELWGGSTKHPDVIFQMLDDIENDLFQLPWWGSVDDDECVEAQIFSWLLYCASRLELSDSAYELMMFAKEYRDTLYT